MRALQLGYEGTAVTKLQQALNRWVRRSGLASDEVVPVTGLFCPKTDLWLRRFQSEQNLDVNGVCGSVELSRLQAL